jgi:hypothetical protein
LISNEKIKKIIEIFFVFAILTFVRGKAISYHQKGNKIFSHFVLIFSCGQEVEAALSLQRLTGLTASAVNQVVVSSVFWRD